MWMKKLQTTNNFGAVKTGTVFDEFSFFLDVKHQISAVKIFHYEEKMTLQLREVKKSK